MLFFPPGIIFTVLFTVLSSSSQILCSVFLLSSLAGAFVLFCLLMFVFDALGSF